MRLAEHDPTPSWRIVKDFVLSQRPEAEVLFEWNDTAFDSTPRARGEHLRRCIKAAQTAGLSSLVGVKIRGEHVYLVRR